MQTFPRTYFRSGVASRAARALHCARLSVIKCLLLPQTTMKPSLLLILFSASVLTAQTAPSDSVKIYTAGPNVTAPELLPLTASHQYVSDHCKGEERGNVVFSLIVDANGEPRNIFFLNPIGDDLDVLALKAVIEDRFKPGTQNGSPVPIAESIDVSVRTCLKDEKQANGKQQTILHLAAEPQQHLKPPVDPPQQVVLVSGTGLSANASDPDEGILKVGGDIKPPIQFEPPDATLRLVRSFLRGADYNVSVVVDRYGMPSRLKIIDAGQPGHEQQAASIVRLWRFKPAMRNGEPVPARIELRFRFH
jgi:hypothetical protein